MEWDEIIYAGIGAIVTMFTFFVPFSPFLGGLVAGWLADETRTDGWRVGLLAGAFASVLFVPLILIGLFVALFDAGLTLVVLSTLSLVGTIYTLGFSALGGYAGDLLRDDSTRTERERSQTPHSQPRRPENGETNLERLKREYAAGTLSEAEFERRLERHLDTDRESARDGSELGRGPRSRTDRSSRGVESRDRDRERDRDTERRSD